MNKNICTIMGNFGSHRINTATLKIELARNVTQIMVPTA